MQISVGLKWKLEMKRAPTISNVKNPHFLGPSNKIKIGAAVFKYFCFFRNDRIR